MLLSQRIHLVYCNNQNMQWFLAVLMLLLEKGEGPSPWPLPQWANRDLRVLNPYPLEAFSCGWAGARSTQTFSKCSSTDWRNAVIGSNHKCCLILFSLEDKSLEPFDRSLYLGVLKDLLYFSLEYKHIVVWPKNSTLILINTWYNVPPHFFAVNELDMAWIF